MEGVRDDPVAEKGGGAKAGGGWQGRGEEGRGSGSGVRGRVGDQPGREYKRWKKGGERGGREGREADGGANQQPTNAVTFDYQSWVQGKGRALGTGLVGGEEGGEEGLSARDREAGVERRLDGGMERKGGVGWKGEGRTERGRGVRVEAVNDGEEEADGEGEGRGGRLESQAQSPRGNTSPRTPPRTSAPSVTVTDVTADQQTDAPAIVFEAAQVRDVGV